MKIVLRDGSGWRQPETKTGRARTVALAAASVHAIRQRLAVIEALQAAGKRKANDPDDLLFPERFSTRTDPKILTIPNAAWINKPAEEAETKLAA